MNVEEEIMKMMMCWMWL